MARINLLLKSALLMCLVGCGLCFSYQQRPSSPSSVSGSSPFGTGSLLVGPDMQGCIWSKTSQSFNSGPAVISVADKLECHLRTLNVDFWRGNVTAPGMNPYVQSGPLSRDQLLRVKSLRLKCNDKLFFDSFLNPNQSLFSMVNLESVSIDSCKIRQLPGNVWATLNFLKNLSIHTSNGDWSTSISLELANEAFQGLTQLSYLDLSGNNIWSLPDRIFCPLRSLVKLNVSRNRLSELEEFNGSPEANYCMLNSVSSVDASFNNLKRIGRIVKWKKIAELRLQNNLLEELDDGAFAELNQLRFINISSNKLVALPPTIFKFNPIIREIHLANNSISAIAPAVFSGLQQLARLDMSRNLLTSQWIRDKMFHGLGRLVVLKLSFNQLSYIDSNIFRDLSSLQSLSLDNNRIESIHPEAFAMLGRLQVLDLAYNRLTALDSKIFSSLVTIKRLYLDHNKIRQLEDDLLANCTTLQDLGLADNHLQEVPRALRVGLKSLETLDIGENRVTSVTNESFSGLEHLFGLRMVDNRLTELPKGFCGPLGKLRVLNVAQNRIQRVSSTSFTACPDLRALRLDTNMLENFPNNLVPQLPSLLWLNVSENRVSSVDYRAIPTTVEWLDLSHNRLSTISGLLDTTPSVVKAGLKLRVLDFSFNRLTQLDSSVIPATLETLRINHNTLKTVATDTFIRSNRLRRVELIGNIIETLPLTSIRFPAIPPGRPLPELYLANNPFNCDCTMEWLTRANQLTALRQHPRIVDLDTLSCLSSMSNRNYSALISIREAKPSQFLCNYKSHCFALCQCCDFDACDCQMSCPGNCTCYHDADWTRNVVDCSANSHNAVPGRIPMDATEIFLDGNHIPALTSHVFIGKKNLRALYFNNSGIQEIRNKTFNGLKALQVLHLQDNLLTELYGYEFADSENIRELYLQRNLIRAVAPDTFSVLKSLEILRLDNNLLVSFNLWEFNNHNSLSSLSLAENPWSCHCQLLVPFRTWVSSHGQILTANSRTMMLTCVPDSHEDDSHLLSDHNDDTRVNLGQLASKVPITSVCEPIQGSEPPLDQDYPNNRDNTVTDDSLQMTVSIDHNMGNDLSTSGSGYMTAPQDQDHHDLSTPSIPESQALNSVYISLLIVCALFSILLLLLLFLFRREILQKFNSSLGSVFLMCCACCGRDRHGTSKKSGSSSSASSILTQHSDEPDKLFDAYFLYSRKDEDFILEKVAPELESGVGSFFRLCIHYRDLCLNPGNPWNPEMIQSACDASKRVVMFLSSNFLQTEWANNESRTAFHCILSRPEVQKKLILILVPPVLEEQLVNFSPAWFSDVSNPSFQSLIMNSSSKSLGLPTFTGPNSMKSSTIHWSDPNFWSKFKLLLPPPLHPSILHSPDHPMLIPATYTISRSHRNFQYGAYPSSDSGDLTIPHTLGRGHLPPYSQVSSLNYVNASQTQQFPPVPPVPGWPQQPDIAMTNASLRAVHPAPSTLTPGHFIPFNESFKRHQQAAHTHSAKPPPHPQSLRLSSKHKQKKPHNHHHHHHSSQLSASSTHRHGNNNSLLTTSSHHHIHQDSNCSNMSNNSRRPLQASSPAGYSSSVETNLSSSNEELDHVYSTLDSPVIPSNRNQSNDRSKVSNHSNSSEQQLINSYSPNNVNSNNNNDPTMYFV